MNIGIDASIVAYIVVGFVIFYLIMSFGKMPADKFGVKIFLGKPKEAVLSGWYFALWLFYEVPRITKKLMKFSFTVKTAVTGRGKIDGFDGTIEPVEVDIKCTVFAQFDENEAKHIVQYSPGNDAQAVGPYLVPYVVDTVRAMAGRLPWRLINRERYKSSVWVQARLIGGDYFGIDDDNPGEIISFKTCYEKRCDKPNLGEGVSAAGSQGEAEGLPLETENEINGEKFQPKINAKQLDGKSPFITLRMKNVTFMIEDLKFSETMMASIIAPEKAKLDGEAKKIAAAAEKTKKIEEGTGDAEARGMMLEKIKQTPELEALSALKEIGKGPSNFIFSLPEFVQKVITNIGGVKENKEDNKEEKK